VFLAAYTTSVQRAFLFKINKKRKDMKKQVHDLGGPVSPAARKKTKNSADSRRKGREKEAKGEVLRRSRQKRQLYDEMVVKGCLLKHIKDPNRETLRDAIEKRVASYSESIVKASSGLMHLAR